MDFKFLDLYYGGEPPVDVNHALTCPVRFISYVHSVNEFEFDYNICVQICGRLGFTESELQAHVAAEHQNSNIEVVNSI